MVNNSSKKSILKTKEGMYVTVREKKGGMKLCAVDEQDVSYTCIEKQGAKMAFCFRREEVDYFLKVVGRDLKIDQITRGDLTESHWFEKVDLHNGAYYGLQSVGEPGKYLRMMMTLKIFSIGTNKGDCTELTDEKAA